MLSMDYLYDESFDGLLTCIYHSYYSNRATGIYPQKTYQYSLINPYETVRTEPDLAAKVYSAIENKISHEALKHIYYVFLSNHPAKENFIHNYLRLGFKEGPSINLAHTHPEVLPILKLSHKVSFEVHRFEGLLRFADTGNFLYAVLEPDHNIIILLADFFADRLKQEHFIIHDKKRNLAVIYNTQEWLLTEFYFHSELKLTEEEAFYQELWPKYFKQIGIKNRTNLKLQSHFVPHRYRQNLPEFRKSML
jgi:probable DNA metabolism protein